MNSNFGDQGRSYLEFVIWRKGIIMPLFFRLSLLILLSDHWLNSLCFFNLTSQHLSGVMPALDWCWGFFYSHLCCPSASVHIGVMEAALKCLICMVCYVPLFHYVFCIGSSLSWMMSACLLSYYIWWHHLLCVYILLCFTKFSIAAGCTDYGNQ